ncbi:MAG: AMP-binding protein [Yaniella sp.]|uniref:AMP-binding protein n=1 Tax=Yaniella sp. TaxID=2773929 RepID=UPI002647C8C9|nr:AMP-binding protein [Yaniella sp.]MDN5730327.1 AMP-binding protein [Yaniella sp.]MDN5814322.1 AMP-binding protein [Yaniella sp.]MDN5816795.1 AMP-binding protein [Yaniella sp.]MDN5888171.1 AMP-binding protein [Yaniella sp.]MDN6455571.1 AMP-binding protein [Yaniella sp.]
MTEQLTYSYAVGPTDVALIEETISINLAKTAAKYPHNIALIDAAADRQWSYEQFYRDVRGLATGLHRAGVVTGERVGIWALNRWEWTMVQYATAEIGAIMVNINPAYRQHELNYVLQQAGITTLISSEAVPTSNYPQLIQRAEDELGALDRVIIMNDASWDEVFDVEPDDAALDAIQATLSNTDPINIQYTSGTTGFPKGATLSHRNILNNGFFVGEINRYTDQDRICIPVPYYHCFGMVMGNLAATTHGAAMVLPAQSFNAQQTLAAVEEYQCTSLYGVPTMFIAELALDNLADFDLSSLRTGIMAGSPCPDEVMRKVIDTMNMDEVTICYGMTETSPVSMQTRPDDDLKLRVSTVGRPSPHAEIKIVDPATGETQPINTPGELCTRGYLVMQGYWNQQDKTDEALGEDGWMRTGDVAEMDENGYVQVTGRMKDMVIRGGENIYPREIEEFLYTHPDILDAQVIGVPDERYGEELMAWVQLRKGAPQLTAEGLREFSEGSLAKYKIPRYVHVVDDFPTTVTGKVRKVEMRETSLSLLEQGGVIDDYRAPMTQPTSR